MRQRFLSAFSIFYRRSSMTRFHNLPDGRRKATSHSQLLADRLGIGACAGFTPASLVQHPYVAGRFFLSGRAFATKAPCVLFGCNSKGLFPMHKEFYSITVFLSIAKSYHRLYTNNKAYRLAAYELYNMGLYLYCE